MPTLFGLSILEKEPHVKFELTILTSIVAHITITPMSIAVRLSYKVQPPRDFPTHTAGVFRCRLSCVSIVSLTVPATKCVELVDITGEGRCARHLAREDT